MLVLDVSVFMCVCVCSIWMSVCVCVWVSVCVCMCVSVCEVYECICVHVCIDLHGNYQAHWREFGQRAYRISLRSHSPQTGE